MAETPRVERSEEGLKLYSEDGTYVLVPRGSRWEKELEAMAFDAPYPEPITDLTTADY